MKLFFLIIILFLINACSIHNKEIIKKIDRLPGVSKELFSIIDSLKQENFAYDNDSLLRIIFYYEEKKCYLIIAPTFYYNEDKVIGYFKHKDWYVFVDSSGSNCFYNHIVPNYLLKERIPTKLLKQSELGDMIVDPYGMKYEVYKDSIVLVYKGFF